MNISGHDIHLSMNFTPISLIKFVRSLLLPFISHPKILPTSIYRIIVLIREKPRFRYVTAYSYQKKLMSLSYSQY